MFNITLFFQKLIQMGGVGVKPGGGWKIFQKLVSGGAIIRYSRVSEIYSAIIQKRNMTVQIRSVTKLRKEISFSIRTVLGTVLVPLALQSLNCVVNCLRERASLVNIFSQPCYSLIDEKVFKNRNCNG